MYEALPSDPTLPTARQPRFFAVWPTTPPTVPAAEDTNTTSPARGRPTAVRPTYPASPISPRTCRAADTGRTSLLTRETTFSSPRICSVLDATPSVPVG